MLPHSQVDSCILIITLTYTYMCVYKKAESAFVVWVHTVTRQITMHWKTNKGLMPMRGLFSFSQQSLVTCSSLPKGGTN